VKCIRCDHDSKYKDRADGCCPRCHKYFAFEPRKGDLLTDAAFQSAIDAVSAKGRLRWGVEHLHYEIARRRRFRKVPWPGRLAVFFVCLVVGTALHAPVIGLIAGGLAAWGLPRLIRRLGSPTVSVPTEQFNKMWKRWQLIHATPKGVIVRQTEKRAPRPAEPDLADYSFDRAVICDRARTADLLIANNVHFENNCAVLSVGGYPPGPFETIRAMLRKNPRLQVFALHDATGPGCRLAHELATSPEWFKDLATVTDVGLRPSHAAPFRGLLLPSPGGPLAAGPGITGTEAEWLSRYALELAAIRPEQILKRLFRAINRKSGAQRDGDDDDSGIGSTSASSDSNGVDYDTESFSADAGDSDGGADAFG
jgi:hypothetical protein